MIIEGQVGILKTVFILGIPKCLSCRAMLGARFHFHGIRLFSTALVLRMLCRYPCNRFVVRIDMMEWST